ncbi:MAG: hypothetical protein HYV68_02985, partial [Candidatus Taylorbacteria bacterium]|nr:hypothetical protein [Candidatus Taylorbacteria bacterium]
SFVIGSRWLQDAGDETVFSVAVLVYANNERVDNCAQVNFEQTFNPTAIKLPDIRISLRNLFDSRHGQGRTDSFKTSMELIVEMLFARYGTLHVYRAESATESPTLEFELQYGTWLDSAQVSSEGFEDVFIL